MAKIQETTTVTIDETTHTVADLSDATRQMIGLMDDWRQRDADLTNELLMVRAAIRDIQNSLLVAIKEETAPKVEGDVAQTDTGTAD